MTTFMATCWPKHHAFRQLYPAPAAEKPELPDAKSTAELIRALTIYYWLIAVSIWYAPCL